MKRKLCLILSCILLLAAVIPTSVFASDKTSTCPKSSAVIPRAKNKENNRILGKSIEERPEIVVLREEFGHWELDSVIGKKTEGEPVVITLTERKTRMCIWLKEKDHGVEAANEALKALFAEFGDLWHEIFKTITTDNGSEFALLSELEDEMLQVYIRTLPAKRVPTSVTTVCYGGSYPRAKAFTTTPPTISASLQIASMVCQGKSSATPRPKNSLTCTSTASTPRDCA